MASDRPSAVAAAPVAPAAAAKPVAAVLPQRRDEIVDVVKVELLNAGIGTDEHRRGFNPYDGRLGRANRDVWGIRKRA